MKKIIFFSVLALSLVFATSCRDDDDDNPDFVFLLNENQSNWSKRLLIQRPISNEPGALAGEYAMAGSGFLFSSGDTVSVYSSLKLISPLTYVFNSLDGGLTWSLQNTQTGYIISSVQMGAKSFALREGNMGIEVGIGMQYGCSWTWQAIAGDPEKIMALNQDTIVAYGDDAIRVSTNGGTSWTVNSTLSAADIQAYDNNSLIGIFGYEIRTSDDLGANWTVLATVPKIFGFLYKNQDGSWFAGGQSGCLYKSTDNGSSWTQKFILTQLYSTADGAMTYDVHFIDATNGFAVIACPSAVNCGDDFDALAGCILRTHDGGETWQMNYRTEIIRYTSLETAAGPNVLALGQQYRDNYVSGIYVTLTTTMGN